MQAAWVGTDGGSHGVYYERKRPGYQKSNAVPPPPGNTISRRILNYQAHAPKFSVCIMVSLFEQSTLSRKLNFVVLSVVVPPCPHRVACLVPTYPWQGRHKMAPTVLSLCYDGNVEQTLS